MARQSKAERRGPARAAAAVACLALGCSLAAAAAAATAQVSETHKGSLDNAVLYLQETQGAEGGWGGAPGAQPNADFTSWAALALAGAGINPQEQAKPGATSAYTYLTDHTSTLKSTTDYALALLVVDASGTPPEHFGGTHLVKAILEHQITEGREDGAFFHLEAGEAPGVNDTVFSILALSPSSRMQEAGVAQAVEHATTWLLGEQNANGSWPSVCPKTACAGAQANVDMTGAALEALNAAGLHDTEAQAKALAFLHTAQNPDGGFPEQPGEHESNSASTAWALQGLWAAGQNPETWQEPGGREPLGYLESMQQANGSIQWKASSDENPIWMTAYAGPALDGLPLPIPEPPPPSHQQQSPPPSNPPASSQAPSAGEAGQGGTSGQPGGGVIAGGGGAGAKLFSRPQPQSRGQTPGGVRQLTGARHEADTTKRRDPTSRTTAGRASPPPQARPPGSPRARGKGTAKKRPGAAGKGAGTGGGGSGGLGQAVATASGAAAGGASEKVTGVVLGDSLTAFHSALQPGAPGLRGAGAGGAQSTWLAVALALAAAALALLGARLERKRPRFVP
jgi:prenyltransferase beta subunit